MPNRPALVRVLALLAPTLLASLAAGAAEVVREERTVDVGGVTERWRLVWTAPPGEACPPDGDDGMWSTCPCAGFEFGQHGDLVLVRLRPGAPEERLPLAPLFADQETPAPGAVLAHRPVRKGDLDAASRKGFARQVRGRAPVRVMELADYDHDGRATELVLQVGAGPCGHQQSVLVGLDARSPGLHAFGSVEEPGTPLVLERRSDWEKVRAAKGEVRLVQIPCGDHGAETEVAVTVRADGRGLHAKTSTKACP